MYPLWDKIVEPALQAAGATRVVEIGALRGETTVRLLDLLGPTSELHVIDPVPMFDPTEHERRFPGRYFFYRDISHNVLPDLPPCDAALIDGDHNWFTVYHELRMLRETVRESGVPMPLLIMHDVGWPYGRRDLYYAPERIPDEFRQPFEYRGIVPGRGELAPEGGLNQQLANAVREGGPWNGVMTALDDFSDEYDRPLRRLVLPIYYGLAVVADQDRLDARPELAALLDQLDGADARGELIELGESIRIAEQIQHHDLNAAVNAREARAASRYLELLKGALLDEHYLENELRIEHLLECIENEKAVSPHRLADPARYMSEDLRALERARRGGELATEREEPYRRPQRADIPHTSFAYTGVGRVRLDQLERCLDTIRAEAVDGDLIDCGTGRGGSAIFLRGYLEAHELSRPRAWVADRFGAGSSPSENGEPTFLPDLNTVREAFARFDLLDERVVFLQGPPASTLAQAEIGKVALLRIDGHDAKDVRAALDALYDGVTLGGFVVVDDYGNPECKAVVDRFRSELEVADPLELIDGSAASWRKTTRGPGPAPPWPREVAAERPLEARRLPVATRDLSLVVVFHNMRREAARTLHSLSRSYQQGVDDLDYEVIVVENGSDPDHRLGGDLVRSFGPEFRYLDLGDESTPSPGPALNRGIAQSAGRTVAVMVDGAHVLTPGVLRFAMLGLATYAPAVVSTQQWYVGPYQQNEAVAKGYDEELEDRIFEEIEWPTDGYRLFDVGHFIGDRDWFDGQWESNCIFVPRQLLEQVGGLDESFSMAGGGFVNLDFFERMASSPEVTLVTILGEGSFHQVHGGTTTNVSDTGERRGLITAYDDHYARLRGRQFHVPAKQVHYIGSLPEAARRTKARRMWAPKYFKAAHTEGVDGRPERPIPVPEELRHEFIDAFWRSKEWQQTTWLGRWTGKAPTDLLAYQDLLFRVRPKWILETGSGGGGRARLLATICDLIGSGQVLAIDDYPVERLAEHSRITYLRKDPTDERTAEGVRELVGERPRAMLILGAAHRSRLLKAFEHYAPLVPVGSYVVVEDTIVNGRPVWPGFGPGPAEAAREIISGGEFAPDHSLERYVLTFNPGGFLKRVR
jgi:cephalosporin hydroxylase